MTAETAADERRVDLVFEGGGVKGIGLAGAFGYLDEQGFLPERVAGTDAALVLNVAPDASSGASVAVFQATRVAADSIPAHSNSDTLLGLP